MKRKFKKGDWVFADFRLMMIEKEIRPNCYSVFDGLLSTSSYNCYPLTLNNNLASMHIAHIHDKLHEMSGLNFPDINHELIKMWVEMCESDWNTEHDTVYKNSSAFFAKIKSAYYERSQKTIGGINIFI